MFCITCSKVVDKEFNVRRGKDLDGKHVRPVERPGRYNQGSGSSQNSPSLETGLACQTWGGGVVTMVTMVTMVTVVTMLMRVKFTSLWKTIMMRMRNRGWVNVGEDEDDGDILDKIDIFPPPLCSLLSHQSSPPLLLFPPCQVFLQTSPLLLPLHLLLFPLQEPFQVFLSPFLIFQPLSLPDHCCQVNHRCPHISFNWITFELTGRFYRPWLSVLVWAIWDILTSHDPTLLNPDQSQKKRCVTM